MKPVIQSACVYQRLQLLKIVRFIGKVASNSQKMEIWTVAQHQGRCFYQYFLSFPVANTTDHSNEPSALRQSQLFPEPDFLRRAPARCHGYCVVDNASLPLEPRSFSHHPVP